MWFSATELCQPLIEGTDTAQMEVIGKEQWPTPQIPRGKVASATPGSFIYASSLNHPHRSAIPGLI